jgi:hypothetical protein
VTADAMHAQRATAAAVRAKGGDYVLALKGNQETLHDDAGLYLEAPPKGVEVLSHQEVGKGHGRVGTRTANVRHDVGWLRGRHDWPGLAAVGSIAATRWTKHGGETAETRHCLLGARLSAADFGRAVLSHWAIGTPSTGCWT